LTDLAAPEKEATPFVEVGEVEGLSEKPESFGRQAWDRFRKHKVAIAGAVLLVLIILLFIFAPMFTPYAPDEPNVLERNQGPSLDHPFGTDDLGRDLMARVFTGGRVSLLIAFIVSLVATSLGTLLGAIAGYLGGFTDTAVSQVINLFLAVPLLPVLLVFAVRFGSNPISVALLLSVFLWIRAARVVRGQFLSLKSMEFVQAARAMGAKPMRIIGRHILPNTLGPILVEATLLAGLAIILESTLSFLGLGVKPPDTSLGVLVDEAKGFITDRPTRILIPGSMITLIVLSINFLGDGLRDALDPTSRVGD
jgi:ABC-type dipeptide/oligopeptide/nickel transport system permease subunit